MQMKINMMVLSLETTSTQGLKYWYKRRRILIFAEEYIKHRCLSSTAIRDSKVCCVYKSHTFSNSNEFVLVCMINYKEDLGIRSDVALSDTSWTTPALTYNASMKTFFMGKGKWRYSLHKWHMHWIFDSPLFPGSRWNEMTVFPIILDHFIASLTLLDSYDWDFNICKNPRTQSWNESPFFYDRGCQQSSQSEVVFLKQGLYSIFLKLSAFPFFGNYLRDCLQHIETGA